MASLQNEKDVKIKKIAIGRFGIGKLATYIFWQENYHIFLKKWTAYILGTMVDYNLIKEDYKSLLIDEREVNEDDAKTY